ncbi:MAG: hypothetical protein CME26_15185 [Gemmatimonadetes bacterium]|nr:hypothetical protein [Gemmatimonadota bacterium]
MGVRGSGVSGSGTLLSGARQGRWAPDQSEKDSDTQFTQVLIGVHRWLLWILFTIFPEESNLIS